MLRPAMTASSQLPILHTLKPITIVPFQLRTLTKSALRVRRSEDDTGVGRGEDMWTKREHPNKEMWIRREETERLKLMKRITARGLKQFEDVGELIKIIEENDLPEFRPGVIPSMEDKAFFQDFRKMKDSYAEALRAQKEAERHSDDLLKQAMEIKTEPSGKA